MDVAGKPWVDIGVQSVNEQGSKQDTKTDKDGNYIFHNLKAGVYSVFVQLPAPNKPYEDKVQVQSGTGSAPELQLQRHPGETGHAGGRADQKAGRRKSQI